MQWRIKIEQQNSDVNIRDLQVINNNIVNVNLQTNPINIIQAAKINDIYFDKNINFFKVPQKFEPNFQVFNGPAPHDLDSKIIFTGTREINYEESGKRLRIKGSDIGIGFKYGMFSNIDWNNDWKFSFKFLPIDGGFIHPTYLYWAIDDRFPSPDASLQNLNYAFRFQVADFPSPQKSSTDSFEFPKDNYLGEGYDFLNDTVENFHLLYNDIMQPSVVFIVLCKTL